MKRTTTNDKLMRALVKAGDVVTDDELVWGAPAAVRAAVVLFGGDEDRAHRQLLNDRVVARGAFGKWFHQTAVIPEGWVRAIHAAVWHWRGTFLLRPSALEQGWPIRPRFLKEPFRDVNPNTLVLPTVMFFCHAKYNDRRYHHER